jgi:hypothetical protein
LGVLGDIEAVTATSNTDARPIALTLTVANATYFSLANGNIDTYRGRPCRIYYAVMDTSCTQILPDPRLVWFGVMDVVANKIGEDGKGAVTLKCEPHSISINRKNTKRVSHQQQLKEYPGDMFYEFLEDLIAKPTLWLSKKFQGI